MIDEKKLIETFEDMALSWGERHEKESKYRRFDMEEIEMVVENQPKVGEWIPCSKCLPEGENEKVIVSAIFDGYEYVTQSYFYHGKFYNKPYYQIPVGDIKECYTGDKVIAWQPLPEVYYG